MRNHHGLQLTYTFAVLLIVLGLIHLSQTDTRPGRPDIDRATPAPARPPIATHREGPNPAPVRQQQPLP